LLVPSWNLAKLSARLDGIFFIVLGDIVFLSPSCVFVVLGDARALVMRHSFQKFALAALSDHLVDLLGHLLVFFEKIRIEVTVDTLGPLVVVICAEHLAILLFKKSDRRIQHH